VYWNHVAHNEGNGIQLFGGGDPAGMPDTGGHTIAGNFLDTNCTCAVLGRRSGGSAPSPCFAHIQLAYIYGGRTLVTHNVFAGPTRGGVHLDSSSSNVVVINNLYWGTPSPVSATEPADQGGVLQQGSAQGQTV
jgi:hypothetical protein